MLNSFFESYREQLEVDYQLALDNKVICDHCGNETEAEDTFSSVTDGTICKACFYERG